MKTHFRNLAFVFPALMAFLFLQTNGVAQEKKSFSTTDSSSDTIFMTWNKNTPDTEMKDDIKALAEKGIIIKYSDVKRNSKGEIIALKVAYSDRKGNKGSMELNNQNPINNIQFFKQNEEIGFGEPSNGTGFSVNPFNGLAGDDSFMKQFNYGKMPELYDFPKGDGSVTTKSTTQIMVQKDGKKPLIIHDGEVIEGADDYTKEEIEEIKKNYTVESNSDRKSYNFNSESDENIERRFEKMREEMSKMNGSSKEEKDDVKEMEKTKEEMIKAKEEMIKAKEEMEKAKTELEKAKSSLKVRKT